MKTAVYKLKNGITCILISRPSDSVAVHVTVRAGSRYEIQRQNGIAHFLEHMAFKGTTKRLTSFDISREVEQYGAYFNAETSNETITYLMEISADRREFAIDLLADIVINSTFPLDEIEREKDVVIQEAVGELDSPDDRFYSQAIQPLMFGDHPMGRPILGTVDTIKTFTREDLLCYKNFWFTGYNMAVCVVGNIGKTKILLDCIAKAFESIPNKPMLPYKPLNKVQVRPEIFVDCFKCRQPAVAVMLRTCATHYSVDVDPLELVSAVLGMGMSSRLFMDIREKRGLAYDVGAESNTYSDTGFLLMHAKVGHANVVATVEAIMENLRRVKRNGITEEELSFVKGMITGYANLRSNSNNFHAEIANTEWAETGLVVTYEEILEGLNGVTLEDTQRVIDRYFRDDGLNLAITGQVTNKTPKLQKILRF